MVKSQHDSSGILRLPYGNSWCGIFNVLHTLFDKPVQLFPLIPWALSAVVVRAVRKSHEHGRHIATIITCLPSRALQPPALSCINSFFSERLLRNLRITPDTPAVDGIMALLDCDGVGTCGLSALMEAALCHPEEEEVRSIPQVRGFACICPEVLDL